MKVKSKAGIIVGVLILVAAVLWMLNSLHQQNIASGQLTQVCNADRTVVENDKDILSGQDLQNIIDNYNTQCGDITGRE